MHWFAFGITKPRGAAPMAAITNTEFAKTLGMPPEWAAKAAAFADAKGLSLAAREVVASYKEPWTGRDGKQREATLMLVVTAEALMALALQVRNFAPISTEFTDDGREWTDVWINASPPAACRVTFEVEGITAPVRVVHTLAEYTQGNMTPTQAKMPATMLAKATRSLGVRQIAPTATGGLVSEEEAHAVEASIDADVEQVAEVVQAVTPVVDEESKGTKLTRAEQFEARKAELVSVGKALRADCGDEAAAALGGAIKARGCDPASMTAADLKALLAVAKRAREDAERAAAEPAVEPEPTPEPDLASRGSHADAQEAWAGIGAPTHEPTDEFVI
jgi:hypothetical protein